MPFEDEVAIICNEEGKVNGLTPNRAVYGESQAVEMTFAEMRSRFCEAENEGKEHLSGYIVFTQDSFDKPYDERSRTYGVAPTTRRFRLEWVAIPSSGRALTELTRASDWTVICLARTLGKLKSAI